MECLKEFETGGYLPVLVITAQPDHKLRALKAGAKDFINKPFDVAEVLVRVHNLLEVRLLHLKLTILNFARLENSQRIAGLGDWEYDFADRRLVWSEGIYRILGISRKQFPPNVETFDRLVHPDDLAFVQREKKAAAAGSHRAEFEHRIIRPDGAVRYFHQITEMSFDGRGRPVRESGTMQDITERKLAEEALRQSEERFKFVARAMSDLVWDWDLSANTLWWHDGFLTTFGFVAGEIEPSVESWTGRIHPDDRSRVVDSIHHAIDAGAESWSAEYRFQRKDGSYAAVQDRGYILRDVAGKGVRMVGGMRDLT
jgi:PAS domain S-box-containing protein